MKKRIGIVIGLAIAAVACNRYDDSELRNKVDALEGRMDKLEELVKKANQQIADLQTLTAGLDEAVFVTGINELSDGYEILFSNDKTITVRNGEAGTSPVIGVKQDTDDVYYWTLNGEWLLDENGGKIRVTGENGQDGVDGDDGNDGITPQLKIEDGFWYVSTDEGATWTLLDKAEGESGDSFFKSVTYDDFFVYFTLADGTTFSFSRGANGVEAMSVIPDFSDGSVRVTPGAFRLRVVLLPEGAAVSVAALDLGCFSLKLAYVETRAEAGDLDTLPILQAEADGGLLILTVDSSGLDPAFLDGTLGAMASLSISDGKHAVASGYFPLYYQESSTDEALLTGTVIGSALSVDYSSGSSSTTVNTAKDAFDGNYDTFFASYDRSRGWVGLDLGEKHIIRKVGCSPRLGHGSRVMLALFEGANEPDFSDALPLGIVRESGTDREMQYIDVNCSRGFRYVRYVGPNDVRCNVSEVAFYGYKGEGDDSRLVQLTNLPTVVINTQDAQDIVSKTEEIPSKVFIISDDGTKLLSTAETGVRGRGNASWGFPKKPYRLKFDKKQSPLGAPAEAKKWTLINNYGDKTLMRNILAFEVSRRVGMAYTPFCQPVDVILNGEYQGCYQLCDQVEVGTGRVEAKKGYLIEIDAYAYDEEVHFYTSRSTPVTVKYPQDDEITEEQFNFIEDFFTQMEKAVFASNYTDPEEGYRRYMDVDSFLKNFIIGEFCGNTDTYWSVYMYKDGADGVFYTGPAWDYDLAFENDDRTYPINNLRDFIYASAGSVASESVRTMVNRIVKRDADATARLKEIWNETKPKLDDLNTYVDETAALLEESQQLNFKRWPILNQKVHQNPKAYGSYQAEVENVKSYITGRLSRFDQLVNAL